MHPLSSITGKDLVLNPADLPGYALRTGLRMLIAMGVSLGFTFTYATWAAKNPRAGSLLVPLLDILQSVPILSFLSVTIVWFLSLSPGRVFGAELACVFTIFTGQAWNMAFSFYQSLRTVPPELEEAGRMFGLTAWARFWKIEAPFAMPPLVWNMMMSMSGGWFFVTISEAISVGKTNIALPGIGSWIAVAIAQKNLPAIFMAIGAMLVVILIYDQLLFRPLVAWADRFRIGETNEEAPQSWALDVYRRSKLLDMLAAPFDTMMRWSYRWQPPHFGVRAAVREVDSRVADAVWYALLALLGAYALLRIYAFRPCQPGLARPADRLRPGLPHHDPGGGADRPGIADLGADRRLCGPAPQADPGGAAGGAVPGRVSRQHPVPAGGVGDRDVRSQSRHLAVAADGAGHPVVHPVQCHRRRHHHAAGIARRRRQFRRERLAVVEEGGAARRVSLLRHRRHHRVGRLVERRHRGGSGQLGHASTLHAHGLGAYIADAVPAAISARWCWAPR